MISQSNQVKVFSEVSNSRVDTLRAELEATRALFHQRINEAARSGWNQKSPFSAWTVGEVLVHLTWALEYLPKEIASARQGKGMFNMPRRLSDMLSFWYMRWLARAATPGAIARRYDDAMDAVVALLPTIAESEWKLGANFYGEGFHSIEDLLHTPVHHLAEHSGG